MSSSISFYFFFNDTATTEIYTLSLHDALPIYIEPVMENITNKTYPLFHPLYLVAKEEPRGGSRLLLDFQIGRATSELQSQSNLVCRLLLEKKKKKNII